MASKDKPSIEEILSSKASPELQLAPTEAKTIVETQKTLIDGQMKSDIDELVTKVLKPRLEILEVVQKAGKDSALARAEQIISARALVPALPEFRAQGISLPPPPPISSLMLCVSPPYIIGSPNPEVADCIDQNRLYAAISGLSDRTRGILSVGARVGSTLPGAFDANLCARDSFFAFEANIARANLTHVVNFPAPLTQGGIMSVTIDIAMGDSAVIEDSFRVLEGSTSSTGNGLVGVLGSIYLTLYGLAQQSPRVKSQTFLLALTSQVHSLDSTMFLRFPFSISESLIMQAGARNIGISVDARITAFRAGSNDPGAGFAGVDLRDPFSQTHGIWLLQTPGGPIKIPRMCLNFIPQGWISNLGHFTA
jgi:hypothetical protein